jgi:hypothetical protein
MAMQNYDNTTYGPFSDETGMIDGATDIHIHESAPALLEGPNDEAIQPAETIAQQRRRQRIALVEEFGGHEADIKRVAVEAKRRGMYSPRTNRGDVELCLLRTWKLRNRGHAR